MEEEENKDVNDTAVINAFKDKTKELFHELGGMDPDEIESYVKNLVAEIAGEYNLDVAVEDVVITGNRARGLESEGENLDVVVYYSGAEPEKSLFGALHENGVVMGGVALNITPVSQEMTGSLSEYLKVVDTELRDRQTQMEMAAQNPGRPEQNIKPVPVVTYTVAEGGEFHSMGEYRDDITTIEEAKKLSDAYRQQSGGSIPAVGSRLHYEERGYNDEQCDFLYGDRIDLGDLFYYPEISGSTEAITKIEELIRAFPEAKVLGSIDGRGERTETEPGIDTDAVKPVYVDEAAKIAAEIDRFSSDFDPREYKDTVDNWELQVQNIAADIRSGNTGDYSRYLKNVMLQSSDIESVRRSAELLVKLAEYKPLAKVEELEEENLNQIDNVLSNTIPKAEERKEIRNTEHERIEEEERKRRRGERQSLRARLAEKKAIVAARGANPQAVKQRQVQTERGVI